MSGETRARAWRVVLANDDDEQAYLIRTALLRASPMPLDVQRARSGVEAIGLVESEPPDLLLLDLDLPGRSGHDVLEHVKADPRLRHVPVAVLTSSDRPEDMARSYGSGGNHFITRPDNPAELERRLRSLLENLTELSGVRRGTGGMEVTAVSAVEPGNLAMRRALPWVLLGGFVVVLAVWVLLTDFFQ